MLDGLVNILLSFFARIFFWILNGIQAAIDELFAPVAALIPQLDNDYGAVFAPYWSLLNFFLPCPWIITLLIAYFGVVLGIMLVQWIVKFIPTL